MDRRSKTRKDKLRCTSEKQEGKGCDERDSATSRKVKEDGDRSSKVRISAASIGKVRIKQNKNRSIAVNRDGIGVTYMMGGSR